MSLYDRIGGQPAVSAAVERFYFRVLGDPILAPFFKDANMTRLKAHQLAFLSQALGGPRHYTGTAMSKAHARLQIEQRHFDAVADHLVETLRELGVGEDMVAQVVETVAPLAKDVVNTIGAASA